MKRFYAIAGALALATSSFAQEALMKPTADEVEFSRQAGIQHLTTHNQRGNRGSEFFCEDFSNGLDGSTFEGAWTVGGNSADVWAMADANSPAGFYSNTLPAMASPTADNGWVIFDCDAAQGGAITPANPVVNMSGWLISPELDMSELENVKVEFNQYFRYCCAQLSPLTVEVSIDQGNSWTVFNATGILITSANQLSANPLLTTIDISCVAANQPSVLVRFAYNSAVGDAYSHYFWGLDDICIYETDAENDLEITQVTNGDIFADFEFTVTPLEQAPTAENGGLEAGVIWRNSGRQDQNNCNILIEILDETESTVLSTTTFGPFNMVAPANEEVCPAPVLDTVFVTTGWVPTEIGKYVVRATISSDATDDVPDNNVGRRLIEYTIDEYGHDYEGTATGELRGSADPDNPDLFLPYGVANYYIFPNDGSTVYGITAQYGANTDPGALFLIAFYSDQSTATGQVFSYETGASYTMQGVWINNGPVYTPFDEPFSPDTESFYTAAVQVEDYLAEELTVLVQPSSDSDNSTLRWSFNSNQQLTWFARNSYSPSIRAILSERSIAVDETNSDATLQIMPNPAKADVRINFNLNAASYVAYEIRDLSGKLVTFDNLGKFAAGSNSFNFNVDELAAGNYIIGLVAEGRMVAREKLVVMK